MGAKERIRSTVFYASSVLATLFLSSLPSFAGEGSLDLKAKAIEIVLLSVAFFLMGMTTSFITKQYEKKKKAGQVSFSTILGYATLGVITIISILALFITLHRAILLKGA